MSSGARPGGYCISHNETVSTGAALKVLVTGATGGFGKLLIRQLEENPKVKKIIGLSKEDFDDEEVEFDDDQKFDLFVGDTRKKRVEEVFQRNPGIDVMVHMAYDNSPDHAAREVEETNVFGTLRMIRLARKYGVKKFVYKSPTIVYGANPDNPALLTEDMPLRGDRESATIRNKIETDMTCQMNMHPGILPRILILRCCAIVGNDVRAPMNTLFKGDFVPMVMGFDPMFQVMHQDDVTQALELAVTNEDAEGIFNIAGKRTEPLTEVIHRFGKKSLPLPEIGLKTFYKFYFYSKRQHSFPFNLDFLKFTFAVDTTRAREVLGYEPKVL